MDKRHDPGHNQCAANANRQSIHRITEELVWSTPCQKVYCGWQALSFRYSALQVDYYCNVLFVNIGRVLSCSRQPLFLCNYRSCQMRPNVLL